MVLCLLLIDYKVNGKRLSEKDRLEIENQLKILRKPAKKIIRDIYSGNWWLGVDQNATPIGFWPKKIFTSLAEYGSFVACGGQVHSPPGRPNPPMGSGFRPKIDPRYDAYCRDFITVNEKYEIEPAMDMEEYSDYDIYKVKDLGMIKCCGHVLLYGGPNKP
ncbi:hypothetical protein Nepgr_004387 [Nepenthes gracilis]|uniref:Neprosin PEP catalytic domain-containing protein n=1 Tax=Nepenthes gracilis TaxID=150966 RepID=A0AAD3XF28_NEPGR|nr:hypothetical protein Nepgr_004387 [Nepenthes gracilis]